MAEERIKTYGEFYPFYLAEHSDPVCRGLHYIGTTLVLGVILAAIIESNGHILWLAPLVGYFFAWVGHFIFEKNRPATFQYPIWSLFSDFRMYFDWIIGRFDTKSA